MKFLIRCKTADIKGMYKNHKTFHEGDSGLDLFIIQDVTIEGGETKLVGLGIQCQLESTKWYCPWVKKYHSYLMFPRSSISKTPLRLANSVGLCDAGYTGELKAALHNTGKTPFHLKKADTLRNTSRSDGGFGSTNL